MSVEDELKKILEKVLQINEKVQSFERSTGLLESIPELDSMAILEVLNAIEKKFVIEIHDDDIDVDVFTTFGSLVDFIETKISFS